MSAAPKTVLDVSPEEAAAIRAAVRAADLSQLGQGYVLASPAHVAGLVDLLSDPAVSDPIYDLPRPLTAGNIATLVEEARCAREVGEGLLVVLVDTAGRIASYSRFTVWPERSAAEIVGAYRADLQSVGVGKTGAARSFGWMFESLGVRLIGVTAALDNVRSAGVIEAAGFRPMGERDSVRPDGSVRRSLYWEGTREAWRQRMQSSR
ncbi:GNAT family N-acetyltransferase [Sinimarinibacterium sp. CAU 1509]|uniref:GNAT family N-acetyltransferase n=1 Tax=Sinimarinibacterium sp. CAU 1509 TaxID=2562283 RepID=UPI0010ACE669|nr:GNAT family N-acetyltransferase [Sinimarinibacterium sp. CAU 1509]TJY56231.1 GNAT family N-acetyltransferase [Sinimarinibacterium sp. CAU 1509]